MGADDAHKGLELINEGSAHRAWHSDRCGDGLPTLHESFEVRYGRLTSLLGEMEDIAKDTRRSSTALLRVSSVCARTVHRSGGFSWRQWRECSVSVGPCVRVVPEHVWGRGSCAVPVRITSF